MGTSYETLMVVGDVTEVVSVLTHLGVDAWVVPAAAGRVAVLPREGEHGAADVDGLAKSVSTQLRTSVLSHVVFDSDAVFITVYRGGYRVHEYVSDRAVVADRHSDQPGFPLGDVARPDGPGGADPGVFAPFGVGSVDLGRLGAALRGEFGTETKIFAEFQHRLIVKAMNLDPAGLTTAFRWARQEDLPGAVRVRPAGRAPRAAGRTSVKVAVVTALPMDADNVAAGQLLADATGGGPPVKKVTKPRFQSVRLPTLRPHASNQGSDQRGCRRDHRRRRPGCAVAHVHAAPDARSRR
ncbi:hypothetical protein [Dactylosporangium sp. NPDC000521]|uniref:hypothetical protein n=1 Tax=Dactylosporangium sp. NPDC000521 TaxID=3363975 RepID=UPI003676ED6F